MGYYYSQPKRPRSVPWVLITLCIIVSIIVLYFGFCQLAPLISHDLPFMTVMDYDDDLFGYRAGDLLLLDPFKMPAKGDIVYYGAGWNIPYSQQGYFGSPSRFARINGMESPGIYSVDKTNDPFCGLVKRTAISGVIIMKIGHSDLYYERIKNIVS